MNTTKQLVILAVAAVLTTIDYLYMTMLRVPSVIRVRPELKEVGFWTGMFSGRSMSWLWYHHEGAAVAITFVIAVIAIEVLLIEW